MNFPDPATLNHAELEEGPTFAPKFDANDLVAAIAVDHHTNAVLMFAHMNAEALALTLQTGEVHYYSRSRAALWKKGEVSGEIQKLVEMRVDCDQDAILVSVEQTGRGAACHTGRKTCFYRKLDMSTGQPGLVPTGDMPLFDPHEVYKK